MIVVLLLSLLVQALSGLFANDEIVNLGPLYAYVSNAQSLALTALHRKLFYWIMGAVGLHIAAVIAHRVFKRENLLLPMWTGRKPAAEVKPEEEISSSRLWLAVGIVVTVIGVLSWTLVHAPSAVASLAD